MPRCQGKGSEFERRLCKTLSLWWSHGERDDLYWRSSMSGGRATFRARKNKTTAGHYGDITSTDALGSELTSLCVIEAKCGYNHASVGDMLEVSKKNAKPMWEQWLCQVLKENELAKRRAWMLITKRNQRETVIYIPWHLFVQLNDHGACLIKAVPYFKFIPMLKDYGRRVIFATQLQSFLELVTPETVKETEADPWDREMHGCLTKTPGCAGSARQKQ